MAKFRHGQFVRSRISGYAGFVVIVSEHLSMATRYAVQPRIQTDKPYELPDAYYIDETGLELIEGEEDLTHLAQPLIQHDIQLGQHVIDKITSARGVVTALHNDINGCVQATVSLPLNKDQRAMELRAAVQELKPVDKTPVEAPKERRGGPATRIPREKVGC
jgi:heat shock protein HspQ